MKKLLLMSIALLGLSGGIAQADQLYHDTFQNDTTFIVQIKATYPAPNCRNNTFTLAPNTPSDRMYVANCKLQEITVTFLNNKLANGAVILPPVNELVYNASSIINLPDNIWTIMPNPNPKILPPNTSYSPSSSKELGQPYPYIIVKK